MELLEHPFITGLPQNDFHVSIPMVKLSHYIHKYVFQQHLQLSKLLLLIVNPLKMSEHLPI